MGKITKPKINLETQPEEPSWYMVTTAYNNDEFFERNLLEGLEVRNLQDRIVDTFVPIRHAKLVVSALKDMNLTEAEENELANIKELRNFVFVKAVMDKEGEVWDYIRTRNGSAMIKTLDGVPEYTSEEAIEKLKKTSYAYATCEEDILKAFNKTEADRKEKPVRKKTTRKKRV